jgi:hypothetical protein
MDVNEAIQAHAHWKGKLAAYIAKPNHSLNADSLSRDNECELGKWLYGEGRKQSGWAGYAQLISDHARFHKAAGEIVRKADAGERMEESVSLGGKSEYSSASSAVVGSLMKLMREIGK